MAHSPLSTSHPDPAPLQVSQDRVWRVLTEIPEDFVNGYAFSIATGSVTILTLFQERCAAPAAALCSVPLRKPGTLLGVLPSISLACRPGCAPPITASAVHSR